MRTMAIDFGDRRIGLAVSDLLGMLTGEAWTMEEWNMERASLRITEEAKKRDVERFVLGLPKNMDGTEGERAKTVRAFAELLREYTELPLDFSDERMSTMLAYRYMDSTETYGKRRRDSVDTLSAEIILQSYLDRERKGES